MEKKYTKGPWEIGSDDTNEHGVKTIDIDAPGAGVESLCTIYDCEFNEEGPANSKLIAVAPELLEAAQFAVKVIYENKLDNQLPKTLSELENAINKALN